MNNSNGAKLKGYARFKPLQEEVLRLREEKAELLDALKTIEARANGDWDNPLLIKHGFLSSEFDNDVLSIVKEAIQKVEKQ
jgi:hypothetical protein